MTAEKALVDSQLAALLARIRKEGKNAAPPPPTMTNKEIQLDVSELVVRFHQQHGNDVGCFSPFLLNCFKCNPGEAIFLAPDEPHAYISGDVIETMACSDNVVRAGLTPKLRDTQTLCDMLTYRTGMAEIQRGTKVDSYTVNYGPPASHASVITEFRLSRTTLPPSAGRYSLQGVGTHALLLVYEGAGRLGSQPIKQGDVIFIPKSEAVEIEAKEDLLLFRCFAASPATGGKFRSCANNCNVM